MTSADLLVSGDVVPVDPDPVDADPVDADPVDADPVDADPVDADPVDADPVDADPVDADPVDADPVDAELVVGLGVSVGWSAVCDAEGAADATLVAEAEAVPADDVGGGVGPGDVHVLSPTAKSLVVAGLTELEDGVVWAGVGTGELVGAGDDGVAVGAPDGVGVATSGVVGVTEGAGCATAGVVVLGPLGVLLFDGQVELGDGLADAVLPFFLEPEAVPEPPGIGWPVPLLVAPPVPPAGEPPPGEDEPMFTIAFRRPGTAMAVPANRKTAATASATGLSQAVPNRW